MSRVTKDTFYEVIDFAKLTEFITEYQYRVNAQDVADNNRLRNTRDDYILRHLKTILNDVTSVKFNFFNGPRFCIKVKYDFSKNTPNLGRLYPVNYNSLITVEKNIRNAISPDYIDIDIVSCHPVILIHYAKKYGIQCKYLQDYNDHREQYLKKLMDIGLTRADAKQLMLRLIFTGKLRNFCKEKNISIDIMPSEIVNFEKEIQRLSRYLSNEQDLSWFFTKVQESTRLNWQASALSLFLQDTERRILEIMINYIQKNIPDAYNTLSLQYDGFMILKKFYSNALLHKLENEVYNNIGIRIKLDTKTPVSRFNNVCSTHCCIMSVSLIWLLILIFGIMNFVYVFYRNN